MGYVLSFILGIFLLFSVVLPKDVDPTMWDNAIELCQNNEGIQKLIPQMQWYNDKYALSVVCNNGAEFFKVYKR